MLVHNTFWEIFFPQQPDFQTDAKIKSEFVNTANWLVSFTAMATAKGNTHTTDATVTVRSYYRSDRDHIKTFIQEQILYIIQRK